MLGRSRKSSRKPDAGHQALVARAGSRTRDQQGREVREAIARGAKRIMEAATALDPNELLVATLAQASATEETAVGQLYGVKAGTHRVSRDRSREVFVLGGEPIDHSEGR